MLLCRAVGPWLFADPVLEHLLSLHPQTRPPKRGRASEACPTFWKAAELLGAKARQKREAGKKSEVAGKGMECRRKGGQKEVVLKWPGQNAGSASGRMPELLASSSGLQMSLSLPVSLVFTALCPVLLLYGFSPGHICMDHTCAVSLPHALLTPLFLPFTLEVSRHN